MFNKYITTEVVVETSALKNKFFGYIGTWARYGFATAVHVNFQICSGKTKDQSFLVVQ